MSAILFLFFKTFVGFLAVMDPVGAIPIVIGMTPHNTEEERRRMILRACIIACIVLLFFGATRMWLFSFFGFTLAAFKLAGGLVLLLLSFDMLNAKETTSKNSTAEENEGYAKADISITPLAIPLLSGPAMITTVILAFGDAPDATHTVIVLVATLAVCLASWLILRAGTAISHFLGATGIKIVTRTMGMLLASMSIQFCADGLLQLFPGWGT